MEVFLYFYRGKRLCTFTKPAGNILSFGFFNAFNNKNKELVNGNYG